MALVLRHLKEWHPNNPYPYRVYWAKIGERFPYNNKPHSLFLNEMENFIKDQEWLLMPYWEPRLNTQNKNWSTSFHTGFRFKREEDAMLFWLRFNGDLNEA
jgi:hypothetical protein